jgi:hypothetical protein
VTAELPALSLVRRYDTHRLIPSKYSLGGDSVLARIAGSDDDLAALFDLEGATNDRLLAEQGRAAAIGPAELVAGVPYASIINAAFTHAHPLGSRFNGPERGTWYAGFDLATSQAEVIFHKTTEYAEIGRFSDSVTYDDYLADVSAELHDVRGAPRFANCLSPGSYVASQALAERLLVEGSLGIVYPSVRWRRGVCLALFQPSLVANVRKGATWRFTWSGSPTPEVEAA